MEHAQAPVRVVSLGAQLAVADGPGTYSEKMIEDMLTIEMTIRKLLKKLTKMKARIKVDDDANEEIKKLQNYRGNQESSVKIMMNQ